MLNNVENIIWQVKYPGYEVACAQIAVINTHLQYFFQD
jgi:hypothetical protein